MGIGVAILQETKVTDGKHTRHTSGYKVYCTKAPSAQQGGIALLWDTAHEAFEVEGLVERTPNVLTFQLVTGRVRYFIVGCYLPPTDLEGVHHVRAALAAAPKGCIPRPQR
jgi:exonuclease III